MHIAHINISAPQDVLVEEKQFFCQVFGLVVGERPNFTRTGYWLYAGDKAIVHLTESEQNYRSRRANYLDHVAFQLTDLDALIAILKQLGTDFHLAKLPELGMTQVFFKSPAGIGLEASFLNQK